MKRTIFISILVFVTTLGAWSLASTQDLGELARQEREKREKDKEKSQKPAKTYTNTDIEKLTGGYVSSVSSQTEPAAGEEKKAEVAGDKGEKKDGEASGEKKEEEKGEAYWRKRATDARALADRTKERLDLLTRDRQSRFNLYFNENDPARQGALKTDLEATDAKIEQARTDAEKAAQALADLADEARRASAPAGWVRAP